MDNFERAANARKALDAGPYEALENTLDYTIPTPSGEEVPGVRAYPISDLIADLFHLAAQNQVPIAPLIEQAMEHFGCDIVEQAWENDDEWNSHMQHRDNLGRVNNMLSMHNIPANYWPGIHRKLGMESN